MSRLAVFDGVVPFVAAAETGSFREAARRLGVTASAVSKAIARLEADVGVRLFQRSARSVALTTDGERFAHGCRAAMGQIRDARAELAAAGHEPRGRVRVSLPPVFASRIIAALPRLYARHADLVLEVGLTDRFVQLVDENVDVAIRIGPLENSTAVVRKLGVLPLITAASPAYLERHGTPRRPEALADHACIRFVLPSGRIAPWMFKTGRVEVTGPLTADHGEGVLAAAIAGIGIVQAPSVMLDESIAAGALVPLLTAHRIAGPPINALIAPGRHRTPRIRAFVDFVASLVSG